MTKGSEIHEALSRHFRDCAQCRDTRPEEARIASPGRRRVPPEILYAMCSAGRPIYLAYLHWLDEP